MSRVLTTNVGLDIPLLSFLLLYHWCFIERSDLCLSYIKLFYLLSMSILVWVEHHRGHHLELSVGFEVILGRSYGCWYQLTFPEKLLGNQESSVACRSRGRKLGCKDITRSKVLYCPFVIPLGKRKAHFENVNPKFCVW